jgi:hypothetical protein
MSTAGAAGRKRTLLLTWWVGMAALVLSLAFKGTAHGNLARGVFYGCLITTAVVWGIELISRRGLPKT